MSLTMKDVARISGVSISTVSSVINNNPLIKDATKKKVLKVINEVGYVPHAAARSLVSSKNRSIGVCLYNTNYIVDPVFSSLISGILDVTNRANYTLSITTTQSEKDDGNLNIMKPIMERRIDGAVIYDEVIDSTQLLKIQEMGFPFVLVNRKTGLSNSIPTACIDYKKAIEIAIDYLVDLGHKRIGIVVANPRYFVTREKLAGYRSALERNRIPFDETLIVYSTTTITPPVSEQIDQCIKLDDPATAIIFHSDFTAVSAASIMNDRGYRIPQEFSIIGFDNILEDKITNPRLTSIDTFHRELGMEAAKMLLGLLSSEESKNTIVELSPRLIVRETTSWAGSTK